MKGVNDIHQQLEDTLQELDDIERSIRVITEKTFMREDDGDTIAVRIADYQQRLKKKDQLFRQLKEEETKFIATRDARKALLQKLEGETNQIEGSHKAI